MYNSKDINDLKLFSARKSLILLEANPKSINNLRFN